VSHCDAGRRLIRDNSPARRSRNIKQPVLIVNGTNDLIVPSINSFTLSQYLVNSKLILWSDSGHGALFQYSQDFVKEANAFLAAELPNANNN